MTANTRLRSALRGPAPALGTGHLLLLTSLLPGWSPSGIRGEHQTRRLSIHHIASTLYKNRFYIANNVPFVCNNYVMSGVPNGIPVLQCSLSKISRDSNSQVPIGLISAQAPIIMSVMEGQICSRSLYFKWCRRCWRLSTPMSVDIYRSFLKFLLLFWNGWNAWFLLHYHLSTMHGSSADVAYTQNMTQYDTCR